MIPLVMMPKELIILKALIDRVASEVMQEKNVKIEYMVGTMIELPRAALMAGEIAEHAEFFSFGTNDLTQTTLGISRDDSSSFIEIYKQKGIVEHDPFVSLDRTGVGELIQIATERGRKTNPKLKMGICGEHGGDPASIAFCQKTGLDYVSCSPYRVPVARLAAAQAAYENIFLVSGGDSIFAFCRKCANKNVRLRTFPEQMLRRRLLPADFRLPEGCR